MRSLERFIVVILVAANLLVWTAFWLENKDMGKDNIQNNQLQYDKEPETIDQNQAEPPQTSKHPQALVPILMYHYIRDYHNNEDPLGIQLSVSPQTFQKQMKALKGGGYQTISLTEYASGSYSTKKPIILTFDDGYLDQYQNAVPILTSYGFTATFFIVRDFIGREGYMSTSQIQSLKRSGMEVGGHSLNHKNLSTMEYEKLVLDVSSSLNGYDQVFCYPSGKYSPVTLDVVSGLGIKAAVTTNIGIATEGSSRYELPRIRVKERTDILKRINEETLIVKKELSVTERSRD